MPRCNGINDMTKFSCSRSPSGFRSTEFLIWGPKPNSVLTPVNASTPSKVNNDKIGKTVKDRQFFVRPCYSCPLPIIALPRYSPEPGTNTSPFRDGFRSYSSSSSVLASFRSGMSKPSLNQPYRSKPFVLLLALCSDCARAALGLFNCEYQRRWCCRSFEVSRCRSPRCRQQYH